MLNFDFAWVRFLDMQMVAVNDGVCTARLDPQEAHLNHNGTVNGPVLFGAAEYAGAAAATTGLLDLLGDAYLVVKDAQIDFVAPARGTVTAVGRCDDVPAAREKLAQDMPADLVSTVELTDASGRLATRVVLTMAIRPKRPA